MAGIDVVKQDFQFIHAWKQGGIIVDNYDISLLQLLLFWKKYWKFERICGCNCCFIIEKEPFVEWIAATGGKLTLYLWKQRRLQVLISKKDNILENTRSLQVASWNNVGTTQTYGCMCFFEGTIRLKVARVVNLKWVFKD